MTKGFSANITYVVFPPKTIETSFWPVVSEQFYYNLQTRAMNISRAQAQTLRKPIKNIPPHYLAFSPHSASQGVLSNYSSAPGVNYHESMIL